MCVCVSNSPFNKDTSPGELDHHFSMTPSLLTVSETILFSNKVTCWVIGGLEAQHKNFGSDTFQPITDSNLSLTGFLYHILYHIICWFIYTIPFFIPYFILYQIFIPFFYTIWLVYIPYHIYTNISWQIILEYVSVIYKSFGGWGFLNCFYFYWHFACILGDFCF